MTLTSTVQNLVTSSPVAKGMTDQVLWTIGLELGRSCLKLHETVR